MVSAYGSRGEEYFLRYSRIIVDRASIVEKRPGGRDKKSDLDEEVELERT